jgi:hypothetical protein
MKAMTQRLVWEQNDNGSCIGCFSFTEEKEASLSQPAVLTMKKVFGSFMSAAEQAKTVPGSD